jgi:ubiquinone/menaquinone biosynthesis C-methylase UbiE
LTAGPARKDRGMKNAYDNAYEDDRLAGAYQDGNAMPEESLRAWAELIGSFAGADSPDLLEIGAGTGMFCAAMARWLRPSSVLGVEPSLPMLSRARRLNAHAGVRYEAGSADQVPAGADAFDLALLSRVIHHVPDRPRAARELARVLRPGGLVVIRTTFGERLDALVYDYWPRLRELDAVRFPSQDAVLADFAEAGFTVRTVTSFAQPVTASLAEYHDRMTSQPQSKFDQLTAAEFQRGLRRLASEVAGLPSGGEPVRERYDVAVLVNSGG